MIDWEEILRHDGPSVWMTAWNVLGNRADADECFQEACLAAVEYSKKHTVFRWSSFLHRLATARAIDRLRQRVSRNRRDNAIPLENRMSASASPLQLAMDGERAERLRWALAQLAPKQAEAFCLFHMNDWTHAEIALELNVSADLVGVWLGRTRDRLRKILADGKSTINEVKS
jgi:RNA polymerase sigma-70 factor, ECF subfamily